MEPGISTFTSPMIAAWSVVAVSLLALGWLAYSAIRNRTRQVDLKRAIEAFHVPDIEAFRNLIDPTEEDYLREQLPPAKFRGIKRQRTWAALIYTWEVGRAAKALTMVGQAQQRSANPAIKAAGVRNTDDALRLQMGAIQASLCLAAEFFLPRLKTTTVLALIDQYRQSAESFLLPSRSSGGMEFPSSKGA